MSSRIQQNSTFLRFLLDNGIKKKQLKKLTKTITEGQLLVICEILYYILQGVLSIPRKSLLLLKKIKDNC